jgi:hypothetical protein
VAITLEEEAARRGPYGSARPSSHHHGRGTRPRPATRDSQGRPPPTARCIRAARVGSPRGRCPPVGTSCGKVVTGASGSWEATRRPGGGPRRSRVTSAGRLPDRGAWNGGSLDSRPGGASPGPDCSRGIPTASGRPHRAGTRSSRHARSDRSAGRGTHGCSRPNAGRCSRPLGSWPSPSHLWPSAGRRHRGGVIHPGSRDCIPLGGIRHPPNRRLSCRLRRRADARSKRAGPRP